MARFGLHEYSTPGYAGLVPQEDKEERPIQKIEKFSTFLNELPWFDKDEEDTKSGGDDTLLAGSTAGVTPDEMRTDINDQLVKGEDTQPKIRERVEGSAPLGQSVELQLLRNADPDTDEFARALSNAELKRGIPSELNTLPETDLFDKAELGQKLTSRPDKTDRTAVMQWQTFLKQQGYDLGTSGPNKDGIDGDWGGKTEKAFADWYKNKYGDKSSLDSKNETRMNNADKYQYMYDKYGKPYGREDENGITYLG